MENTKAYRREFLKTAGAAFTTSIFTGRLRGANDRGRWHIRTTSSLYGSLNEDVEGFRCFRISEQMVSEAPAIACRSSTDNPSMIWVGTIPGPPRLPQVH